MSKMTKAEFRRRFPAGTRCYARWVGIVNQLSDSEWHEREITEQKTHAMHSKILSGPKAGRNPMSDWSGVEKIEEIENGVLVFYAKHDSSPFMQIKPDLRNSEEIRTGVSDSAFQNAAFGEKFR